MSDRNKVVRELEHMAGIINQYTDMLSVDCDSWVILDALELLKAQPEIVRCKDCKYCDSEMRGGIKIAKCELRHNWMPLAEWFCADGER